MILVNFMPWRERARNIQKYMYLSFCGVAALCALVLIGIAHITISSNIANQQKRIVFIEDNIRVVRTQVDAIKTARDDWKQLLAQLESIYDLQRWHFTSVGIMSELSAIVPEGVHLKKLMFSRKEMFLEGYVDTNIKLSVLMKKIMDSKWFFRPELKELNKAQEDGSVKRMFTLRLTPVVAE